MGQIKQTFPAIIAYSTHKTLTLNEQSDFVATRPPLLAAKS
jgi:hypothetical protein